MIDDYEKLGEAFDGKLDFGQTVYTIEWGNSISIKEHQLRELAADPRALDDLAHVDDMKMVYFTRTRAEEELAEILEAQE
jgi:hypothetical protein